MGLSEEQTTRGLACLGLSFHEIETARLVVELLDHRLAYSWRCGAAANADVVVVDPQRVSDAAVLDDLGDDTVAIALVDHDAVSQAVRAIYRPLSPRALIAALNAIDRPAEAADSQSGGSPPFDEAEWQSHALTDAFRAEPGTDNVGVVVEIVGIGDAHLVVDSERDRIYGPIDALSLGAFASNESFQTRVVGRNAVEDVLEAAPNDQLCTYLARLAGEDGGHICVFGDMYRSKVRLNTWPDLSSLQIDREYIKAVTLVRHSAYTVAAAAAFAGVNPAGLLTLFNALYINGTLDIDTRDADETVQDAPTQRSSNGVLNRIREQIGMG